VLGAKVLIEGAPALETKTALKEERNPVSIHRLRLDFRPLGF
jgi:hypothetical protein